MHPWRYRILWQKRSAIRLPRTTAVRHRSEKTKHPAAPRELDERTTFDDLARAVDELRTLVTNTMLTGGYDMVMNVETLCVHKANKNTDKDDSSTWRAMCGWNIGIHMQQILQDHEDRPGQRQEN